MVDHLTDAATHRFGFNEYLHAWRRRVDALTTTSVPQSRTPISELRVEVKTHNDKWKEWLSTTQEGKVCTTVANMSAVSWVLLSACFGQNAKARSRKKRSVDPKNYDWDSLNQFLNTVRTTIEEAPTTSSVHLYSSPLCKRNKMV